MRLFRRQPRRTPVTIPLSRAELIVITTMVVLALVAVIGVAVAISYSHMFDWALINGEPRWRAHLSPLSVDGAMFAASFVMYADARMRNRPDWLAYLTLFAGIGWSVLANMNHDWVDPIAAKAIAAWPPLSLAVSVELVLRFIRRLRERSETQTSKAPAPKQAPVLLAKAEPEPFIQPAVQRPNLKPAESAPAIVGAELTAEMREAGWAPDDYSGNLGAAMLGYLEKVDSEASGSDLWTTVGVRYFGKTGRDSGMGRTVVRNFKASQAAKSAAGE